MTYIITSGPDEHNQSTPKHAKGFAEACELARAECAQGFLGAAWAVVAIDSDELAGALVGYRLHQGGEVVGRALTTALSDDELKIAQID